MKNLFIALLMFIAMPASAASLQIGGTFGLERNVPVQGSLALEAGGLRLWGAAGDNKNFSFGGDILHRSPNGLYAGLGAVVDYTPSETYSHATSDTLVSYRKHDNGKHIGDTHIRSGKRRVSIDGNTATVTYEDAFDGKLGIITGWSAPQGPFVENRLVINTFGDITARATVGLRF